jgi:hypothetical protein
MAVQIFLFLFRGLYNFFKIFSLLFSFFFFYYCAWWEYIVAFTNVLTIYQIYHDWIILLYPHPSFLERFQQVSFFIYTHVYTVFAPYSPSHTLSLPLPPSNWYQPPHSYGKNYGGYMEIHYIIWSIVLVDFLLL